MYNEQFLLNEWYEFRGLGKRRRLSDLLGLSLVDATREKPGNCLEGLRSGTW